MLIFIVVFCLFACSFFSSQASSAPSTPPEIGAQQSPWVTLVARTTCKQVSTCEAAVQLWCNGYGRADGDGDGIPCENVCDTKEEVDEIRQQIGC